ncbi:hypothetical protein BCR33DRAFT_773757 [Rhizoclosmatium globosum]|uniref:Zn(2)-C6 fungal-type domain-containing protein n=1 Tax=Rhizoclosmatium globosum TaxID=329046 RepID=A0A1Y2AV30_9FUNG|nr:hypothetical protein BCR33DRAFT_773757 [Rhizoclosmatium globosum]|eukprot:ORY26402.1 hypothetical protein BCR33DRAFT_773757 [Rhizoclosmatium globosum]
MVDPSQTQNDERGRFFVGRAQSSSKIRLTFNALNLAIMSSSSVLSPSATGSITSRSRRFKSCLLCQTSKKKCDRGEPCLRCKRLGKLCVYHPDQPRSTSPPDAQRNSPPTFTATPTYTPTIGFQPLPTYPDQLPQQHAAAPVAPTVHPEMNLNGSSPRLTNTLAEQQQQQQQQQAEIAALPSPSETIQQPRRMDLSFLID